MMEIKYIPVMMLLTGLVGSSVVMADTSGASITNGNGSISFSLPVTSGTCSIAVTDNIQNFVLTSDIFADSNKAKVIATKDTTFTLTGCKNEQINVSIKANNDTIDNTLGALGPTGNCGNNVCPTIMGYRIRLSSATDNVISGGASVLGYNNIISLMGDPMKVSPDNDNCIIKATTLLYLYALPASDDNGPWKTSYTYNFTYA
ncbi:hypothetical protein GKU49_21345 [Salmonella enterica]|nr:type 1 fimbrial protein [Salmonella enterica]EDF8678154.1 hypothetical protein [Salmonella enterica]EEF5928741.1 hypothetical protein [Salmonella enterica]EEH3405492.1 type 1 fimbrial protein [Salmonella enterica]EIM6430116.1 type 1 fimbrial protein [Salmonella enterica]